MCKFKPTSGNLVESSDDPDDVLLAGEESEGEDSSDDDTDSIDNEDIADVGEEAGQSGEQVSNPFFAGSDESDVSDTSDEEDEAETAKPEVYEEDELVIALKAAREKKERNSPPDIKTLDLITDLSFHPERDLLAIASITGDLSVFSYNNEANELQKKLKLSTKSLRGLEFDESGSSLLTVSKDRTFRILDTETWQIRSKHVKCHDSALYSVYSLDEHTAVTGDEDGFVKM